MDRVEQAARLSLAASLASEHTGRSGGQMWFYPLLLILVLLGIAGAIFMGGVFTLILVPLVVVALASTLGYAMWARSQASAGQGDESGPRPGRPLPHQPRRESGHVTAQPEGLVDARRQQQ